MASYKNPYNTQQNQAVNSIGDSLAEIFMPNSNSATSADLYVQRANRYAQLAAKTELEAIEQNVKNQQAIREAEDLEYLMGNPEVMGMLSNQLGVNGRLAQIVAGGLFEKDPTLLNNRFALRRMEAMTPAQQQQAGRNQVFARGQQPKANFAMNENAADVINQRMIDRSIAQAEGKLPSQMARDNNRFNNSMVKQDDQQDFTGEQNALNRASREGMNAANITSREGIADANRLSREGVSDKDRASREGIANRKQDAKDNKPIVIQKNERDELDGMLLEVVPQNKKTGDYQFRDLGNGADIDEKIGNYVLSRVRDDYEYGRAVERKSHLEAMKYARMGLTRPQMMKTKRFEVPGFNNDAKLPLIVIEDLKDMPESDRLPVLQGFGYDLDQAKYILEQIKK